MLQWAISWSTWQVNIRICFGDISTRSSLVKLLCCRAWSKFAAWTTTVLWMANSHWHSYWVLFVAVSISCGCDCELAHDREINSVNYQSKCQHPRGDQSKIFQSLRKIFFRSNFSAKTYFSMLHGIQVILDGNIFSQKFSHSNYQII